MESEQSRGGEGERKTPNDLGRGMGCVEEGRGEGEKGGVLIKESGN